MKKLELSLTSLRNGESGVIVSIGAPSSNPHGHHGRKWFSNRRWGFKSRLEDMGLTPGTKVTIIKSAPFRGPVELLVRGARLAIGRGMAERIPKSI